MSNFHVHSYYSARDGIQSPEAIANFQKSIGKNWFSITDHGSMASHPEAFEVAKKTGMNFLAGCEFYVKPDYIFDGKINIERIGSLNKIIKKKTSSDEEKAKAREEISIIQSVKGYNEAYYHITVFAFNRKGLSNLYKINENADFYYKTRILKSDLFKYSEGLIVLSGCPSGEFFKMVEYGYYDLADEWMKDFKEVFKDRVYMELMFHDGAVKGDLEKFENESEENFSKRRIEYEKSIYKKCIEIARANNVKIVGSNDSHYTTHSDRKNWLFTRMAMIGPDKDFTGNYHMMKDNKFFEESYPGLITSEELDESENEIISRYEPYEMFRSKYFSGIEDKKKLERLIWTGFKNKRLGTPEEKASILQIPYELAVIQLKDFDKYFLTTRDVVKSAFEKGVLVGPGRGSGAGSECVYLIDITSVDPLLYGLMFERFLNPGRNSMPDIDLDLSSTSCENFKPNKEYKDMFFTSNEVLVSDEEIKSFWKMYHEARIEANDNRRREVFEASGVEYFEGFCGDYVDLCKNPNKV